MLAVWSTKTELLEEKSKMTNLTKEKIHMTYFLKYNSQLTHGVINQYDTLKNAEEAMKEFKKVYPEWTIWIDPQADTTTQTEK